MFVCYILQSGKEEKDLGIIIKVTGYIDDGDSVDVIFLDFAKAFDKVSHRRDFTDDLEYI